MYPKIRDAHPFSVNVLDKINDQRFQIVIKAIVMLYTVLIILLSVLLWLFSSFLYIILQTTMS